MPRCKYTRPCDLCSSRKVRCDDLRPCTRCVKKGVECTSNRIRKKCGPKKKPEREEDPLRPITPEPIPLDSLVPVLQAYQSWYYGWWPVINCNQLISELTQAGDLTDYHSSFAYCTLLSVCAAISRKLEFLRHHPFTIPNLVHHSHMINLCQRLRYLYNHDGVANSETITTGLFLWVYYINIPNGTTRAIAHFRMACSMAQTLRLQVYSSYDQYDTRTRHRLLKLWHALVVTDRFMCVEDGYHIVLRRQVPYPNPQDEALEHDEPLSEIVDTTSVGYKMFPNKGNLFGPISGQSSNQSKADLVAGFNHISQVFCAPDVEFYDAVADAWGSEGIDSQEMYGTHASDIADQVSAVMDSQFLPLDASADFSMPSFGEPPQLSREQLHYINTQSALDNIVVNSSIAEVSALNIILTKFWIKSIAWNNARQRQLLTDSVQELSWGYPSHIAISFLQATSGFDAMTFESNGPGVVIKLLGIANGVAHAITHVQDFSNRMPEAEYRMVNALHGLFALVTTFKTEIKVPAPLYERIEQIIQTLPRSQPLVPPIAPPISQTTGTIPLTQTVPMTQTAPHEKFLDYIG